MFTLYLPSLLIELWSATADRHPMPCVPFGRTPRPAQLGRAYKFSIGVLEGADVDAPTPFNRPYQCLEVDAVQGWDSRQRQTERPEMPGDAEKQRYTTDNDR